jgi:hypothetical protein
VWSLAAKKYSFDVPVTLNSRKNDHGFCTTAQLDQTKALYCSCLSPDRLLASYSSLSVHTRGCALKRGRFESFCAISLVRALPRDVIIQTRYTMALLVVYWLYTRGFSFDRPLGLRPIKTGVQPENHAPPSYNLYIYNTSVVCPRAVACLQ